MDKAAIAINAAGAENAGAFAAFLVVAEEPAADALDKVPFVIMVKVGAGKDSFLPSPVGI